jgi:acyl-CoA hydrolase
MGLLGSVVVDPKPPSASEVVMTQLVLPSDANNHGNAFGGRILSWIDISAAVAAGRHSGGEVVTASMDDVHFIRPIRQGHVVVLRARVNYVGRSSMEVGVRVEGEPWGGERYHALTAYTTFVGLSHDGRPRPVPPLLCESPDDARRRDDGERRMEERRARRRDKKRRLEEAP